MSDRYHWAALERKETILWKGPHYCSRLYVSLTKFPGDMVWVCCRIIGGPTRAQIEKQEHKLAKTNKKVTKGISEV